MQLLINCDMGEWDAPHMSYLDHKIMPLIDMANIACGAHAGSEIIIKHTLTLAKKHGIRAGAHIGYDDRPNFGRQYIEYDPLQWADGIRRQVDLFVACCETVDIPINHIKPHGALYHAVNHRRVEAEAMIKIMVTHYSDIPLLVLSGSLLSRLALEAGLSIQEESFVDRTYQSDLSLTPRSQSDAVITDVNEAVAQYNLLARGLINTTDCKEQSLSSQTTCIHGDNPAALQILAAINSQNQS